MDEYQLYIDEINKSKPKSPVSITKKPDKQEPEFSNSKYGMCLNCHKPFTQEWDKKLGRYSDFNVCPECRERAKSNPKSETITYKTDYIPYDYQLKMHQSNARFRVISGGIRAGKDYSMIFEAFLYCIKCANEDREARKKFMPKVNCWIVGPTDKISKTVFNMLRKIIPKELVFTSSPSTGVIELTNGIVFEAKSAYDPESLVSAALDCVLITEAARIADLPIVWTNLEGRLVSQERGLNGEGGIALINSSPLGRNYFYKMWLWGNPNSPDYDPDWESFTWTTWDNPYQKENGDKVKKNGKTYRENLIRRTGKTRYEQDFLAKFLIDDTAVFPEFEKCLETIPDNLNHEERKAFIKLWRSPKKGYNYTIGYDPAEVGDEPIIYVIENNSGKVVYIKNMKGKGWDEQFDFIQKVSSIYNYAPVHFGRTGHTTIDSQLKKRNLMTVPIDEQGSNKSNLVSNLSLIIEQQRMIILDDGEETTETAKLEFSDYTQMRKGNSIVFKNGGESPHDDHVSAAYFAFWGIGVAKVVIPFDCNIREIHKSNNNSRYYNRR